MVADMIANLRDDDVMYDIGANVGFHSAFGAKCGSTVYAFEPYPPNFRQLNRNLSYNSSDVGAFEIALSDDNGETKFAAPSSTVGYGTGRIGGGKRVVETRRGDDFIQEHGLETPDVIKIDVEGAEAAVIDGMSDTLQGSRRIYVELHLPADHRSSSTSTDRSPADLLCDLRDREFNVQILSNRGDEIQIVAERQ